MQRIDEGGPEAVERIQEEFGRNQFSPQEAARFDHFIRTFLANANDHPERQLPFRWLRPWPHIWAFVNNDPGRYTRDMPISAFRFRLVELYHGPDGIQILRDEVVREIELDAPAASESGTSPP